MLKMLIELGLFSWLTITKAHTLAIVPEDSKREENLSLVTVRLKTVTVIAVISQILARNIFAALCGHH